MYASMPLYIHSIPNIQIHQVRSPDQSMAYIKTHNVNINMNIKININKRKRATGALEANRKRGWETTKTKRKRGEEGRGMRRRSTSYCMYILCINLVVIYIHYRIEMQIEDRSNQIKSNRTKLFSISSLFFRCVCFSFIVFFLSGGRGAGPGSRRGGNVERGRRRRKTYRTNFILRFLKNETPFLLPVLSDLNLSTPYLVN